jgi:hypothetical protein
MIDEKTFEHCFGTIDNKIFNNITKDYIQRHIGEQNLDD